VPARKRRSTGPAHRFKRRSGVRRFRASMEARHVAASRGRVVAVGGLPRSETPDSGRKVPDYALKSAVVPQPRAPNHAVTLCHVKCLDGDHQHEVGVGGTMLAEGRIAAALVTDEDSAR
jgi:hypothetical protein